MAELTHEQRNEEIIARLEKEYRAKIIDAAKLKELAPEFVDWISEGKFSFHEALSTHALILRFDDDRELIRVVLFTDDHKYSISIRRATASDKGYLGGGVTNRKSLPGEIQFRGADLDDGDYSKETFDAIFMDILYCELQKLDYLIPE